MLTALPPHTSITTARLPSSSELLLEEEEDTDFMFRNRSRRRGVYATASAAPHAGSLHPSGHSNQV